MVDILWTKRLSRTSNSRAGDLECGRPLSFIVCSLSTRITWKQLDPSQYQRILSSRRLLT